MNDEWPDPTADLQSWFAKERGIYERKLRDRPAAWTLPCPQCKGAGTVPLQWRNVTELEMCYLCSGAGRIGQRRAATWIKAQGR